MRSTLVYAFLYIMLPSLNSSVQAAEVRCQNSDSVTQIVGGSVQFSARMNQLMSTPDVRISCLNGECGEIEAGTEGAHGFESSASIHSTGNRFANPVKISKVLLSTGGLFLSLEYASSPVGYIGLRPAKWTLKSLDEIKIGAFKQTLGTNNLEMNLICLSNSKP